MKPITTTLILLLALTLAAPVATAGAACNQKAWEDALSDLYAVWNKYNVDPALEIRCSKRTTNSRIRQRTLHCRTGISMEEINQRMTELAKTNPEMREALTTYYTYYQTCGLRYIRR